MLEPLYHRLDHLVRLSLEDRELLAEAIEPCPRHLKARRDLFAEGEGITQVYFILGGWMERYTIMEDGRRQITELLLPGDVCGREALTEHRLASHYGALSTTRLASIAPARFFELMQASESLMLAFLSLLNASDFAARSWIVSLGQRTALERLSHFICEVHDRLALTWHVDERSFEFPLRQSDLAALLGMSTVHVNRTFQQIRARGLIAQHGRRLTILKPELLRRISLYGESAATDPQGAFHHGLEQAATASRHAVRCVPARHAADWCASDALTLVPFLNGWRSE